MWESLCHGWSSLVWLLFLLTSACTPLAERVAIVLRPPLIPGRNPVDPTDLKTRIHVITRLAAAAAVGYVLASAPTVASGGPARSRGQPRAESSCSVTTPTPEEVRHLMSFRRDRV